MYAYNPRAHYYRYVLGLAAKEQVEALERGTRFHEEIAAVYRNEVGSNENLSKWRDEYEDLDVATVEQPLLLPLAIARRTVYAGGVLDALVTNRASGKHWVLDHKNQERMYVYPELYAAEQLGVYKHLARETNLAVNLAGGCLSRVLYKPLVKFEYGLAYTLKWLNTRLELNARTGRIGKMRLKDIRHAIKGMRWLPKHKHAANVRTFDDEGQMVASVAYIGDSEQGALIHVERQYIPINEEREVAIWTDFAATVGRMVQYPTDYRRTGGFNSSSDVYASLSLAEQKVNALPGTLADPKEFEKRPPNEEVLKALDKANQT
jgi:hypothetical protein